MEKKRKYLVTGAKGMLGQAIVAALRARGQTVAATDLPETDLSNALAARDLIHCAAPTHLIHCAAHTDVDGAETQPERVHEINALMPGRLARLCADTGAWMLFLSTDFVFDGLRRVPYRENAAPNPLNVYGRAKLEGERAVAAALDRHQIVRSAWLFGPGGRNFVSTMHNLLKKGTPLRVIDDQYGSPTYTLDLATRLIALTCLEASGVFHMVNAGQTTRHALTRKIAQLTGHDPESVAPTSAASYPTPARRPDYSVLDCSRAWSLGVEPMRPWEEALASYAQTLEAPII